MRPTLSLLVLLATPLAAQDAGIEARMEACTVGVDLDTISAEADAFANARGYEARVGALCAAGDRDGAIALARQIEADYYAENPEAARVRDCLADVLGEEAFEVDDVCEQ